jgi:uncharacterized protein (TIGR01319 family)
VCVDVGSTFTKAAAVAASGALLATAQAPTTPHTDVLDGIAAAVEALGCGPVPDDSLLVCSSAGGGLRLGVVGQERVVSVEAGRRVALSAGARVVGTWAGPLAGAQLEELAAAAPDVVLLVGGTDGGDPEVLLHNAGVLGRWPFGVPVVVAGNAAVGEEAARLVRRRGRAVLRAGNVIPRIGELAADSARASIRELFITHVIGGKGLSRGARFPRLVRGATPDAVLAGVEVVAEVARPGLGPGHADLLVVDVGGATTDVYSVLGDEAAGEAGEEVGAEVVGRTRSARTVEGDLGVRWSAQDLVAAADRERLDVAGLREAAARRATDVGFVASAEAEAAQDRALVTLAAVIAVRRHARPGAGARDLRSVGLVVGSGGVLRHADPALARAAIRPIVEDRAGGWALPREPRLLVDTDYLLAPIGLLALAGSSEQSRALATALVERSATAGTSRRVPRPAPREPRSPG